MDTITLRSDIAVRVDEGGAYGTFDGVANVMGVIDSYDSVWFPGAFSGNGALDAFVARGWIAADHDWDIDEAIGYPTAASESGNLLEISGAFHSTSRAQSVRAILSERPGPTGLSVAAGLNWDRVAYFESGSDLWAFAQGSGFDMALFDPSIRVHDGYCWAIPEVSELREVSITLTPAVPGSTVATVRSAIDELREGSRAGLTLEDHLDGALAVLQGVGSRLRDYVADRAADGRGGSRARSHQLSQLATLARDLERTLERGFSAPPKGDTLRLQMETEQFLAGL